MDQYLLWERLVTSIVLVFFTSRFPVAATANRLYPALFAFGDSILDTGNNNFLQTPTKCNFPPYGKDFPGEIPTGRFGDGKVLSDFIGEALGIKETLSAFLSRNISNGELPTGVSFASGGSGIDDLTAKAQGVLPLSAQLGLFQNYKTKLTALVGAKRASNITSKGLYLFSSGNNDIALTYSLGARITLFPNYADTLVVSASNFLKNLYRLGARHVWVLSTLPLGCLPGLRTAFGGPLRPCAEILNGEAKIFNDKLATEVSSLKTSLPNFDVRFIDVYTPLLNLIQNPLSAGFINVANGCCGTGTLEMAELCNPLNVLCPNASTYVFWDAGHPTQRAYQLIVSSLLQTHNIGSPVSSPLNFVSQ